MKDRRKIILEAGLAILREQGLAGLTQPRIAAKTGLRQSHLTYYYPTRADLLTAVARVAIEGQLRAVKGLVSGASSPERAADRIASAAVQHDNTRLLAALNQAADQEPAVRKLFGELLDGFVTELGRLLDDLKLSPNRARIDLIHALFVGLAIIDLATGRRGGKRHAKVVLTLAFDLLSGERQ